MNLMFRGWLNIKFNINLDTGEISCITEPLSKTEDTLLREVLSQNLKIDSAPFRQHLVAHLKRLLMRVRDGAIGLIKSGDSNLLGKYQAVENVSEKKKIIKSIMKLKI